MAEYYGIHPNITDNNRTGGSASVSHMVHAALALDAGLCDVAVLTYGSTQQTSAGGLQSPAVSRDVETVYKPRLPVSAYALAAQRHMHEYGTTREQMAAVQSGQRAYAQAGVSASDIDVVELYDAFTINAILFLEDLGFCPKGEGGAFVEGGNIAPGGSLPVNTNGGGLSCCHPGQYGMFANVEAVRQIMGHADKRQVGDVNLALAHTNGGYLSSQATAIYGTADTL